MTRAEVLERLGTAFGPDEVRAWGGSLGLAVNGDTLAVRFPHRFFADWFERAIRPRFEAALADTGLRLAYENPTSGQALRTELPLAPGQPYGAEFVFENFLVNSKNFFPLASAQEVALSRDAVYNPFVLCGESGSGKSFLLRAIANTRYAEGAGEGYVAGVEELHELFTSRTDARRMLMARQFLAVDDLQDLVRYQYLQGELLALFDHFHLQRKQMMFASTGKISTCGFLLPKLKSRLEWGLTVILKVPDLDIRTQFVQIRCRERKLELPRERVLLLAQRFPDLRNLEGCLLKLWAYRELVSEQITDDEFDNILNYLDDRSVTSMSAEQIIGVVSAHYNLEPADLMSSGRRQELVLARQVAMYLCRRHLGLSYPELGRAFGGRDHSTALYSCRKIEQLQRDDKKLKSMLQNLTEKCLAMNETGLA